MLRTPQKMSAQKDARGALNLRKAVIGAVLGIAVFAIADDGRAALLALLLCATALRHRV